MNLLITLLPAMAAVPMTASSSGAGIPVPYTPRMDDAVALLLLACVFVSAYVLSRCRKFLFQLVKDFLLNRDRSNLFSVSTAGDMRSLMLLLLQTCILGGVFLFCCLIKSQPELAQRLSLRLMLGTSIGFCLVYLTVKWMAYSFLGWIFLDKSKTSLWIGSYSTLLYYLGFALSPFVLLAVYFDLSLQVLIIIGLFLLLFAKILMFYKWLKLFCHKLHGVFLLILYFCALEIMPCLVLYQTTVQLKDLLIIKF